MRRLPLRSPPRMRGKADAVCGKEQRPGITPAYAGKRFSSFPYVTQERDHPRVCGEKASQLHAFGFIVGSPPRVRGKALSAYSHEHHSGITPACAGKRSRDVAALQLGWDHPRVCGEKSKPKPGKDRRMGSPPRMRGKGANVDCSGRAAGITPACAGKRMVFAGRKSRTWDHPRVCGEKGITYDADDASGGSPPRMRGKGQAACEVVVEFWITPACAGKSCSSSVSSSQRMSWTIRSRI